MGDKPCCVQEDLEDVYVPSSMTNMKRGDVSGSHPLLVELLLDQH